METRKSQSQREQRGCRQPINHGACGSTLRVVRFARWQSAQWSGLTSHFFSHG